MNNIKYRKASSSDVNQLSQLFDTYRLFYGKESDIEGAILFLNERIANNDSEIFVAENSKDKLLGFVQLYPLFSSTRMKKLWLLNDLFVNPEYRSQGISIELINKAKQLVIETNACGMYLETEISNLIGNNLYPKTGFVLNDYSNFYEWNV
jgi:GNAT superfamily N-acetyltransferase